MCVSDKLHLFSHRDILGGRSLSETSRWNRKGLQVKHNMSSILMLLLTEFGHRTQNIHTMENLSKTIAEVKSALDQATQMLDENQSLRDEIQSLKSSPNAHRNERELRIAQLAFEQGIESVFFQLTSESTRHELSKDLWTDDNKEFERREGLLKDDSFFNMSPYNYNIIRS